MTSKDATVTAAHSSEQVSLEGDEVQAIMECAQRNHSDLLVLGLHRHSVIFGRLWNHTTHDLTQQLSSSILGVHLRGRAGASVHFRRPAIHLSLSA
jgi:nucleotide-binding universal stress UspA family protein